MMSESKKNSKIEPIFITDEMLEEDNIDSKLRERLIEDADEVEKALEFNPKLDGIEAPAGMLDSITASLKDQGYWEDEDASEASVGQTEELPGVDTAEVSEEVDDAEDAVIMEQQVVMKKAAGAEGLSDDDIYQLLSPKDRAYIIQGRKGEKQKKWKKALVRGSCVIMVLGGVFCLSMTSDANRKYIIGIWNSIVSEELNIQIEDIDRDLINNSNEENAYKQIQSILGTKHVNFIHKDSKLVYDNVTIDQRAGEASVYYFLNDTIAHFRISKGHEGTLHAQVYDGSVVDTTEGRFNNMDWTITELENPNDERVFVAQTQIVDTCYSFSAVMNKDEFISTIENIIIQ